MCTILNKSVLKAVRFKTKYISAMLGNVMFPQGEAAVMCAGPCALLSITLQTQVEWSKLLLHITRLV